MMRVARSGATDWRNRFRLVVSVDMRGLSWRGIPGSTFVSLEPSSAFEVLRDVLPLRKKLFPGSIMIRNLGYGI
jgi:hypothetical protein